MCGIAGIYSIDGTPLRNLNMRIHKMAELLRHRGPDSTDSHVDSDNRFALLIPALLLVTLLHR